MAVDGQAPAFFKRLTRGGVRCARCWPPPPGLPVHVQRLYSPKAVYILAAELAGMTEFIVWPQHRGQPLPLPPGLCETGLRHRRPALQGRPVPLRPAAGLVLCLLVTLGQNYQAFLEQRIDWIGVISTHLAIPLFLAFWIGHRLLRKSRWIPYATCATAAGRQRRAARRAFLTRRGRPACRAGHPLPPRRPAAPSSAPGTPRSASTSASREPTATRSACPGPFWRAHAETRRHRQACMRAHLWPAPGRCGLVRQLGPGRAGP